MLLILGIGCPLLISINIDQKTEKIKKKKNDQTGTQARLTGSLANSEDPDEMPHKAAFHQCLHCLIR